MNINEEELKEKLDDIKEEAGSAYQDIKSEAEEVVQEARAAVTGQKLDSANTVGGAGYRAEGQKESNKATISLVLGIVSIICAWFGYSAIVGLILGIIGLNFGAKARKEAQTGMATGGFVCSLVGTILSGLGLLCVVACVGTAGVLGVMESLG